MEESSRSGVILFGRHPVLEALRSGTRPIEEILVDPGAAPRLGGLLALARAAGIRTGRAPRPALTGLAGSPHHQGVVARVGERAYASLETLLAVPAARAEPALILVLDQVQDPGNLGSLLRTAEALGVHGAILPKHHAAGLTSVVAKAAAGALEHLPVARVANLVQTLEILKQAGCWVVGATARDAGAAPPWDVDLRGPLALVLGSEGSGLRPLVARTADQLVRLPLAGRVAALGVTAAGAALMAEIRRQRVGGGRRAGNQDPGTSPGGQKGVDREEAGP